MAFADQMFARLSSQTSPSPSAQQTGTATRSTLVLAVGETSEEDNPAQNFDLSSLDKMLGAGRGGPAPQAVKFSDGKVAVTFASVAQSGLAKSILENNPECKKVIQSISTQRRLYPAKALFVDLTNISRLGKEIALRNPHIGESVKVIKPIHRSGDGKDGHVKLLFDSASARDEAIQRGTLFVEGRRIRVVEIDWSREVRRCYKCQKYGHLARQCTLPPERSTCGYCSGQHKSSDCDRSKPNKCANCGGGHPAGDLRCPEQIKMGRRLKAMDRE